MSTNYREIKLNKNQHQQYKTVKEFKPEWNDEEIINFCQQRDWEKNTIQDDLQKAFEFDHSSLEQWHTVGTTKKEEKTQTSSSTRGRSSERGGRGRGGRARSTGVFRGGRGGRGGSVAANDRSNGNGNGTDSPTDTNSATESQDESKAALSSPTEEKQPLASTENRIHRPVDIRERTGKRAKREKESGKPASGVQLPTPGKSYAMAVKPLPPPPPPVSAPVQSVHSTPSTASSSHSHSHTHAQSSTKKIEEQNAEAAATPASIEAPKLEEKEEKKAPTPTVPSFASVAKGAWRRKKDVAAVTAPVASVSQPQVPVPEIVQPKEEEVSKKEFDEEKTETKVEVSPTMVLESTPIEEESKPQHTQQPEVVEQLPTPTEAATLSATPATDQSPHHHHHIQSAPKSPAVPKSAPRSPAKSPLKLHESSVSHLHPETHQLPPSILASVSAAPLPAVVSTAVPVNVSAAPVSELLTATETVILPHHIIAAVQAPAVQIQFGSAKTGGPRAPQPHQTQIPIVASNQTPVAAQAAPVQVQAAATQQTYAAATLSSQRTVPISSILGTVNAVQSETKFNPQPAPETAPVSVAVAAAPEQTFEQHHASHAAIAHPAHAEEQALLQQPQQQQQTQTVPAAAQTYPDAHAQPAQVTHAAADHQHIYGANFPTLAQTSTAAAVGGPVSAADSYGAQAGYVAGDQQGDMYSMYGADQPNYQSMYGDQFYGQQMRRGGPQDVKGKPKFNAIGPNQNRGPQQHNKPHQQQQQQRQPAPQQQQPFTNQQAQAAQRITPAGYQAANQYNNQVPYKQPNVPASPQHNLPQYQQQQQQQQGKGAVGQYKPNQYNQAKNVPMNQPINQTPGMVSNQFSYGMHAGAYGTSAAPYLSYPQQYYGGYYGMQQQQPFYRQPQYPFYPSTYSSYPAPMTGGFDQTAYDANGQPDFSKHYAQQPANAQATQATDIQGSNVAAQTSAVDSTNQPAAQYADASWQQMKTNPAKPADSQFQTNYAAMQNVSAIHQQQQTHIPQQPHTIVHQPIQPHMQAQQNTYGTPFQPHMPVHPADAQRAAFPNWGQPNAM